MKKTTIFAVAAACGAVAFAVPDWNQGIEAQGYANPKYTITDAVVTQTLSVKPCKALKTVTQGDITLFEDGSYVMYRDDWAPTTLTGTWALIPSKTSNTVYMSINNASLGNMFGEFNADALANCKLKYPAMTSVSILEPSALIKKNTIVVKIKGASAKGTLMLSGKQENDAKGAVAASTFKATVKLTGLFVGPLI